MPKVFAAPAPHSAPMTRQTANAALSRSRPIEQYASEHPQLARQSSIPPLLATTIDGLPQSHGVVLDVGCGEGGTLRALRARQPHTTVVGCDLSAHRAAIARLSASLALVGDAERLPIGTATCDVVICRHVIEHVDDKALLAELARVLKPGGQLYLETPLRLRFAWYPYRNAEGRWVLDPTHLREYASVSELELVIRSAEFDIVAHDVAPIRYPVSHIWYRVTQRALRIAGYHRTRNPKRGRSIAIPRYREVRVVAARGDH
jgi:SAM-dependent methyltransferase